MKNYARMIKLLSAVTLAAVLAAGCTPAVPKDGAVTGQADGIAKMLYDSKTQYIGDAPSSRAILDTLLSPYGSVKSIELKTDTKPYGITVHMEIDKERPSEDDFKKAAAVYFMLVENADSISFADGGDVYTVERAAILAENLYGIADYDGSYESFGRVFEKIGKTEGYATVEEAVSGAVLAYNAGKYADGECAAEGNVIIEKEEKDGFVNVYAYVSYGEYGFENNVFTKVSGSGAIPTKLVFSYGGEYVLKDYIEPMDGSEYVDSIKEMFPRRLWSKVLSDDSKVYKQLEEQEHQYAARYLSGIGRTADIGDTERILADMNVDASNKLLDMYGEYPYWVGTCEKLEDGVRTVYEKQWESRGGGDGTVKFIKYADGEIAEETIINVNGEKLEYVKGEPRGDNYAKTHG